MRKCLVLIIFLILPSVNAWNWYTHQNIVELIYNSIEFDMQRMLNLSAMEVGSIAPDKYFHDNRLHHYPSSYRLAENWLNRTIIAIKNNDFENASYSFGVFSHYVSDSFSAPHYIAKEPAELHKKFEKQVSYYPKKVVCNKTSFDLNESLNIASRNKQDWGYWVISFNSSIPEREVNDASDLIYLIALDIFNTSCIEKTRFIETRFMFFTVKNIVLILITITLISLIVYSIKRE